HEAVPGSPEHDRTPKKKLRLFAHQLFEICQGRNQIWIYGEYFVTDPTKYSLWMRVARMPLSFRSIYVLFYSLQPNRRIRLKPFMSISKIGWCPNLAPN